MLVGQDKDGEMTYQLLLWAKQIQIGEMNLLPVNIYLFTIFAQQETEIKHQNIHRTWLFPISQAQPHSLTTDSSPPALLSTQVTLSLCSKATDVQWVGRSCVKVSTQHFLSAAPSFLHFFPAPAWMLHRPVLLGISICCSMGSSAGCTGYLLCRGTPPPPPLTLVLPLLCITSPTPLLGIICPLLNMLSPTPLARLMGSAASCSGLILEPAESGTGQLLVLSHRDHPAATLPFTPNTWFYMYDVR